VTACADKGAAQRDVIVADSYSGRSQPPPQESLMPTQQLKNQLEDLQRILAETDQPLSAEERASLQQLADRIEARLLAREQETGTETDDTSLVDSVNLSIEHFYARHPTVAGTLQRVVQALSDMGI